MQAVLTTITSYLFITPKELRELADKGEELLEKAKLGDSLVVAEIKSNSLILRVSICRGEE